MKKFIINVQEIQNNEYGDPVRSLLKSGVLTVESRWDALKVARNIAKRASRARVYSCEPVESYWRHGASKVRNAAACFVFHNHPSGDVTPSREDKAITERLVKAGHILDVPVLDHIIIGDNFYSFRTDGTERRCNIPW